jgi:hypothetical protein
MSDFQLHLGDCLDVLPTLPAGSVQCVVTSPPYFGLRDYGTADWQGGDAECDHLQATSPRWSPCSVRCEGCCGMTGRCG